MGVLQSFYNISESDYGGERTSTQYGIPALNDANIAVVLPALGLLKTAHVNLTIGVLVATELTWERARYAAPNAKASSKLAQRENKWLIRYYDAVTFGVFTLEIGCADLSLLQGDGDTVNLTDGQVPAVAKWTDYKTQFELTVDTPDGNNSKLIEAVYVGRST